MVERSKSVETAPATGTVPGDRVLLFTTRVLPWLLAVMMLIVFGVTLNHWIAPDSIGLVAGLEGLTWTPHLAGPVTWLLLRPLGCLPAGSIPLAVNVFTMACAAVSLGFLARSVALLPHDLSKDPPLARRGFEPPALMASRTAWLPPLFAVLACGLQLSFWQNAITGTGEMINLLMFAYVIRGFLEFNASGRDSWLLRAALVYGLAVANDWSLGLFIPAMLVGLIWVKRLYSVNQRQLEQMLERRGSFKLHLLWQIPSCWLAGFSLVLLLPIVASLSTAGHMDFWPALEMTMQSYRSLLHLPRQFLITSSLICVMPVFLIGLRYYHFLGGGNRLHLFIGTVFFQLVFGFVLMVNLWTLFDTPLSPRRQAPGLDTLPFYWLEALSIGYFLGHFLLTAETPDSPASGERRRSSARKQSLLFSRGLKWATRAGVVILVIGIPAALVHKNLPEITFVRANPFTTYCQQLAQTLPPEGAVIMGEDAAQLAYLEMDLIRNGTQTRYLLLNAAALAESTNYWTFLTQQKHPGFDLNIKLPNVSDAPTRKLIPVTVLEALSKNHSIYCFPPAPLNDYLAEMFYFEPHGLIYQFGHYRDDQAFAPPIPPAIVREDESFWQQFQAGPFTNMVRLINPPQRQPASGLVKRFVNTFRFWPEADLDSTVAGRYYAVALNDWGVELQRAGKVRAAGECFANALELNLRNAPAEINQEFNADYQAHQEITIQKPLDTVASMNKYRDWHYVAAEGAVDEPNFCYMMGAILADNHLFRPAIAQFERVKQLSPANLDTAVDLARLFVESHDITNALVAASDILAISPTNETGLFLKSNSDLRMENYKEAIPLLNEVLSEDPTNNLALLNRAIAYRSSYLFNAARRDYGAVIQANPKAFPAYYDLAQMDDAEFNVPAAMTNYELFLKYAPPNLQEIPEVQARLKQLQSSSSPMSSPSFGPLR
jgi:tetratricopeptide (TPR) repeat protein